MNLRIILIYPADPIGPKVGGIETFLKGFIKYSPHDFEIEFIGITADKISRPPGVWMKLKLANKEFDFLPIFYEKNENKKTVIPLSFRFTLALKFTKIDLFNKILFFDRIEPAILFKKSANPKLVIIHNDVEKQINQKVSESLWSKIPLLYFRLENSVFKSVDYIFTVNNDTLKFYESKYPDQKEKLLFLPTWVDVDIFYPVAESKPYLRSQLSVSINSAISNYRHWILFVGRLQEQKAPLRLIEAFSHYYESDKSSALVIIGGGNLKKAMERYVKTMKLEHNVFFIESMRQDKLADFYRAADALVLTSNFEGMPRCVLEALGCGLPIISTDVGEAKRIVKNGSSGEIARDFSPIEIAKLIKKVINNPSVYTTENCLKAINEYVPQKVLEPLYAKIRGLWCTKKRL